MFLHNEIAGASSAAGGGSSSSSSSASVSFQLSEYTQARQWHKIEGLILSNSVTSPDLNAKVFYDTGSDADDYYETIFVPVVWFFALSQQWQLIDILLQRRLLTAEHLAVAPPICPDTGKNIVWLMAYYKQWDLIRDCVSLINDQHLTSEGNYQRSPLAEIRKVTALNFLFTYKQTQLIQAIFRTPRFLTHHINLNHVITREVMFDLARQHDSQTFYRLCELGALDNARNTHPYLPSETKGQDMFILQYYDELMRSLMTGLHDNFNLGLAIPAMQQITSYRLPPEILYRIQTHMGSPVFSKTLEQRFNGETSRYFMEIETLTDRSLQKYQSQWSSPFTVTHAHGYIMSAHDLGLSRQNMIMTLQKVLTENGLQHMIFDSTFRLCFIALTGSMGEREIELEPGTILHIIQTALKASL